MQAPPDHHKQYQQQVLQLLQQYVVLHGCLPKRGELYGGRNLGGWCSTQRQMYRKGRLSREVQQALEQLPGWRWQVRG
jgi:hypothetical protein